MKFLAIVSLTVLVSASVHAALDKAYFNRLSTEKVTSSDLVTWTQIGPGMAGYCATGRRHLTAERSIVCKTQ